MERQHRRFAVAVLRWVRARFFSGWPSSLVTFALVLTAWHIVPDLFRWAVTNAVWSAPDGAVCREMKVQGACWAFVAERLRFFLFGTFPADERWRPACVLLALVGLIALTLLRVVPARRLVAIWLGALAATIALLAGGWFGLRYVENERWGGLTLTLLLSVIGLAGAFPLGVVLALARRSEMPIVRWLTIAYIEVFRGVPLITVLFMASALLPLFLPAGATIDKLLRAQLAMIAFAAAYIAEVVRGGLQAVARGQEEAALALGLNYFQRIRYVILPQALRIAVPPLVNTFIGFFKDTSLVVIIGLMDFLTTVKVALTETAWTGFGVEAYLFAAAGYFLFCYPISRYSRKLEVVPVSVLRAAQPNG